MMAANLLAIVAVIALSQVAVAIEIVKRRREAKRPAKGSVPDTPERSAVVAGVAE
jgi:hypothetical protein